VCKFGEIDKIRKATNGNFALGTDRFQEEVSEMVGRRVFSGKAGRPKNDSSS
jgi:putative transposase